MQEVKCIFVGDGYIGKRSLLTTYTTKTFPEENPVPTVFNNYSANVVVADGQSSVKLCIWDLPGQQDYERLRPIYYSNTDVIVLCYSIVQPASFANISTKWMPELRRHCPKAPVIVVGTKLDLRDDPEMIRRLLKKEKAPISHEDGVAMSIHIQAAKYMECSAIQRIGLDELFNEVGRIFLKRNSKTRVSTECILL